MAQFIRIKNWEHYQHYKDRNPPWIKLHQDLMTDDCWVMANDAQKALIISIMMLAARMDNNIPNNPIYIKKVAHLDAEPDLKWLIENGFCVEATEKVDRKSPWPSRNVKPLLREQVFARDGHACKCCGVKENLEVDHIVPVSKGGESNLENLQTLCRSCNRRKRTRVAAAPITEQALQHDDDQCSLEGETEQSRAETETLKSETSFRTRKTTYSKDFEETFWKLYPTDKNMSKADAWKQWQRLSPEDRADAVKAISPFIAWIKTQKDYRTLHACRFLSQRRFEGFVAGEDTISTFFVSDDTSAFARWVAARARTDHPIGKFRVELNGKRGLYFPTELPTFNAEKETV